MLFPSESFGKESHFVVDIYWEEGKGGARNGPAFLIHVLTPSVLRQKSLYFDCHSGLDPESSISELDSRWSAPRT